MVVEVACTCDDLPPHSHVWRWRNDGWSPAREMDPFEVRVWIDWKQIAREFATGSGGQPEPGE